ncbi:unnamed protein product [Lymnaea stagnalis]|uniref:Ankyrin repeat domain-containing protein 40 n=1 Tax=Lymnaea stagnalis TaxID=6523 RepID=A0AAV2HMJ9_LYMST
MSLGEDSGERLREAACVGDLNLLAKLESQGVDINSKNAMNGWTALHWACKRNHVNVVQYLLGKGADKSSTNKEGHVPAQLTSNEEIWQLLGAPPNMEIKHSSLPITPNYMANPPFPYVGQETEKVYTNYSPPCTNPAHKNAGGENADSRYKLYNGVDEKTNELVLKARIANCDEKDFIEVELGLSNINFAGLLNLLCAELGVDKNLVMKIRKLPDTILRKDKDVKRLKDFQELELVLTNKAMSAASRTYSLGPARNHETILY